jgi:hypothetical protein
MDESWDNPPIFQQAITSEQKHSHTILSHRQRGTDSYSYDWLLYLLPITFQVPPMHFLQSSINTIN